MEKLSFRVDDENGKTPGASPDTWWYVDLWKMKIPVYCLTSLMSDHLRLSPVSEVGKDAIELDRVIFVRCKGDYWNSATWDNVSMLKSQIRKLPKFVSKITYDALYQQKLLYEVDAVKDYEDKITAIEERKKSKVEYKTKHSKEE